MIKATVRKYMDYTSNIELLIKTKKQREIILSYFEFRDRSTAPNIGDSIIICPPDYFVGNKKITGKMITGIIKRNGYLYYYYIEQKEINSLNQNLEYSYIRELNHKELE